jgi:uncharacterized repeat protein (TIGR02543 family)
MKNAVGRESGTALRLWAAVVMVGGLGMMGTANGQSFSSSTILSECTTLDTKGFAGVLQCFVKMSDEDWEGYTFGEGNSTNPYNPLKMTKLAPSGLPDWMVPVANLSGAPTATLRKAEAEKYVENYMNTGFKDIMESWNTKGYISYTPANYNNLGIYVKDWVKNDPNHNSNAKCPEIGEHFIENVDSKCGDSEVFYMDTTLGTLQELNGNYGKWYYSIGGDVSSVFVPVEWGNVYIESTPFNGIYRIGNSTLTPAIKPATMDIINTQKSVTFDVSKNGTITNTDIHVTRKTSNTCETGTVKGTLKQVGIGDNWNLTISGLNAEGCGDGWALGYEVKASQDTWNDQKLEVYLTVKENNAAAQLTITFDPNGETIDGGTYTQKTTGTTKKTLTTTQLTAAKYALTITSGREFVGWFDEKVGGTEITAQTEFTDEATIYAHYTGEYTITFNKNDGDDGAAFNNGFSGSMTTEASGILSITETQANNMFKTMKLNHIFGGWYKEATCENAVDFTKPFGGNTPIYAKWIELPKITFKPGDNSVAGLTNKEKYILWDKVTPFPVTSASVGKLTAEQLDITWTEFSGAEGYEQFDGWIVGETSNKIADKGENSTYNSFDLFKAGDGGQTYELTATWTGPTLHTITFNKNETAGSTTIQTRPAKYDPLRGIIFGEANMADVKSKFDNRQAEGLGLAGWATTDNATVPNVQWTDVVSAPITIYAVWKPFPYVTFDPNEKFTFTTPGWNAISNPYKVQTNYNNVLTEIPGEDKLNSAENEFTGWFKDMDNDNDDNPVETMVTKFEQPTTVYAHWKALPKVTFEINGGKPLEDDVWPKEVISYKYGTGDYRIENWNAVNAMTFTVEAPEDQDNPDGRKKFAGWKTTANGATADVDQSNFSFDGSMPKTLYAHWSDLPMITFHLNGGKTATGETTLGSYPTSASGKFMNWTMIDNAMKTVTPPEVYLVNSGWATAASGTTADVTITEIYENDATIYAFWKDRDGFTITFHSNPPNGTDIPENITVDKTWAVTTTDRIKLKGYEVAWAPTGKVFNGWYYNAAGTGKLVDLSLPLTDNTQKDIYAKWKDKPDYSITVAPNIWNFGAVIEGEYTDGSAGESHEEKEIIITNTSSVAITDLHYEPSEHWVITGPVPAVTEQTPLAKNATASFKVKPKTDLTKYTYDETITFTIDEGETGTLEVLFNVLKPTITVGPTQSGTLTDKAAGSATYNVKFEDWLEPPSVSTVTYPKVGGTLTGIGITSWSLEQITSTNGEDGPPYSGTAQLKVTKTDAAVTGSLTRDDLKLTVTASGTTVTSEIPFELKIQPAGSPRIEVGTQSITLKEGDEDKTVEFLVTLTNWDDDPSAIGTNTPDITGGPSGFDWAWKGEFEEDPTGTWTTTLIATTTAAAVEGSWPLTLWFDGVESGSFTLTVGPAGPRVTVGSQIGKLASGMTTGADVTYEVKLENWEGSVPTIAENWITGTGKPDYINWTLTWTPPATAPTISGVLTATVKNNSTVPAVTTQTSMDLTFTVGGTGTTQTTFKFVVDPPPTVKSVVKTTSGTGTNNEELMEGLTRSADYTVTLSNWIGDPNDLNTATPKKWSITGTGTTSLTNVEWSLGTLTETNGEWIGILTAKPSQTTGAPAATAPTGVEVTLKMGSENNAPSKTFNVVIKPKEPTVSVKQNDDSRNLISGDPIGSTVVFDVKLENWTSGKPTGFNAGTWIGEKETAKPKPDYVGWTLVWDDNTTGQTITGKLTATTTEIVPTVQNKDERKLTFTVVGESGVDPAEFDWVIEPKAPTVTVGSQTGILTSRTPIGNSVTYSVTLANWVGVAPTGFDDTWISGTNKPDYITWTLSWTNATSGILTATVKSAVTNVQVKTETDLTFIVGGTGSKPTDPFKFVVDPPPTITSVIKTPEGANKDNMMAGAKNSADYTVTLSNWIGNPNDLNTATPKKWSITGTGTSSLTDVGWSLGAFELKNGVLTGILTATPSQQNGAPAATPQTGVDVTLTMGDATNAPNFTFKVIIEPKAPIVTVNQTPTIDKNMVAGKTDVGTYTVTLENWDDPPTVAGLNAIVTETGTSSLLGVTWTLSNINPGTAAQSYTATLTAMPPSGGAPAVVTNAPVTLTVTYKTGTKPANFGVTIEAPTPTVVIGDQTGAPPLMTGLGGTAAYTVTLSDWPSATTAAAVANPVIKRADNGAVLNLSGVSWSLGAITSTGSGPVFGGTATLTVTITDAAASMRPTDLTIDITAGTPNITKYNVPFRFEIKSSGPSIYVGNASKVLVANGKADTVTFEVAFRNWATNPTTISTANAFSMISGASKPNESQMRWYLSPIEGSVVDNDIPIYEGRAILMAISTGSTGAGDVSGLQLVYNTVPSNSFSLRVAPIGVTPDTLRFRPIIVSENHTPPAEQKFEIYSKGTSVVSFEVPIKGGVRGDYEIRLSTSSTPLTSLNNVQVGNGSTVFYVRPRTELGVNDYSGFIRINNGTGEVARLYVEFEVLSSEPYRIVAFPKELDFGSRPTQYRQPEAKIVEVVNMGLNSIELLQPKSAYFDIGPLSRTVLDRNGATATFTVRPMADLPPGTYNDYPIPIQINGSNDAEATVNVKFTVEGEDMYGIRASGLSTFGTRPYGVSAPFYTQPPMQIVTVRKIGDGVGAITVTLPQSTSKYLIEAYAQSPTPWTGSGASRTAVLPNKLAEAKFTIQPRPSGANGLPAGNNDEAIPVIGTSGIAVLTDTLFATFTLTPTRTMEARSSLVDFGEVDIGYAPPPAAQTVTIANTCDNPITLTSLPSSTANFTLTPLSPNLNLARDDTKTFTVRPKPGLQGPKTLVSKDTTYIDTIKVVGTGGAVAMVLARITVKDSLTHKIRAWDSELIDSLFEFAGTTSSPPSYQTVTVGNLGSGAVTLRKPVFGAASRYELVETSSWGSNDTVTIGGDGGTAFFNIQPKAAVPIGTYRDTITINGYYMKNGAASAVVSNKVILLYTKTETLKFSVSVSPSSKSFGSALEGYAAPPAAQTVTVTNIGTGRITLSQPGSSTMNYIVGPLSAADLAPNRSTATFTVQPMLGLTASAAPYAEKIYIDGEGTDESGNSVAVRDSVTVTFTVGDGTPPPTVTYTITLNATVWEATRQTNSAGRLSSLDLREPTRDGYTFKGWFLDDGLTRVTTSYTFTADAAVYAMWEEWGSERYAVTFRAGANGALSASVEGSDISTGVLVQRGKDVVFTAVPTDGYSVVRWTINGVVVTDTSRAYVLAGISRETIVLVSFDKLNEIKDPDREIPKNGSKGEAAIVAPSSLSAELAAGPNPVSKSQGSISLYRSGSRIVDATLTILDATGSTVNKIKVADEASTGLRRKVGSWNLKDAKGRTIPVGTYVIKGVIKTTTGKTERVSVVVGVK